jgi:hypothetical protein
MPAQIRTFGSTTWILVLIVVLLTVFAGLLYVAE